MSFLSPLALIGLLFVPLVLAMYLLKLRRDDAVVPSTLLWQRLVADLEANAPWQRIRRSLLLLLQLLLVLLLAFIAARPFLERPAGLARDLVIVIDTSASMAATDLQPNRLAAAKTAAIDALHDLPADGKVSVIAAGRTARVVVNGTSDLGRVRAAIDDITISEAAGDLDDALTLANALAARSGDAEILVATDAALATTPTARVDHPVTVLQVGRERRNQAVVALAVRPAPSGVTRSVFVSIANLDIEPAQRRLELYGDGVLLEARDVFLDPQTRSEVIVDDVPKAVTVVEVRLAGDVPDNLAIDDRGWAIVPEDRTKEILLVSDGDPYLETALTYLPNVQVFEVSSGDYPTKAVRTDGTKWDLIIFEGALPESLPETAILAIAPTESSDLGEVTGTLTDPAIGSASADEPILRYVDLSTTHVGKAVQLVLPAWARAVLPGPGGAPLLYVGERNGQRAGVLAFEPRDSDLPLQVAFPILVANLTGELLGGAAAPTAAVVPGDAVTLPLPAGATGLNVVKPDGATVQLAPGTTGAASVPFSETDRLGVYIATAIFGAGTSAPSAGGESSTPATTAVPTAVAGSPGPTSSAKRADPRAPVRFAVDLFDIGESDIAPGSPSTITALGQSAGASPGPSSSVPPAGVTQEPRSPARDELWVPIVLLALAVLLVEWLVFHRDAVLRLWRRARPATSASPTSPAPGPEP